MYVFGLLSGSEVRILPVQEIAGDMGLIPE